MSKITTPHGLNILLGDLLQECCKTCGGLAHCIDSEIVMIYQGKIENCESWRPATPIKSDIKRTEK